MTALSNSSPIELHWVQQPGQRVQSVLRPSTLDQALEMLSRDPSLRPIAGGTDLLLDLQRSASTAPISLVDLTGVAGLTAISVSADGTQIVIGAGATHNDVVASQAVVDGALPLAQACLEVGSPQLRNRATIAGNLATASPANDTISALMALRATVTLVRLVDGDITRRSVLVDDFFTGFRTTVLEPGELIESIVVPVFSADMRGVWAKLGLRKAQAISVVHGGVVVALDDAGAVTRARVAMGSVAATVVRLPEVEAALIGDPLTGDSIARAAAAAAISVVPIDDGRATAEYRTEGVRVLVSRCLHALAENQQASQWPGRVIRLSNRSTPLADDRRASAPPRRSVVDDHSEIAVTINGQQVRGGAAASATLLDWVRDNAGLGTKEGCAEGECGACTVVLDDDAVMSCLVPAVQADSAAVTTIEGLAADGQMSTMQQQFVNSFAVQCGYCIPGFVMAATTLVEEAGDPSREEIGLGLSGNLCRCTGYYPIIDAVERAAESTPRS